ncbi:lipase-like PAD4 [Cryptomeria japonica]|uniref:lipase-like PAD4 n=1 Tax=Cryptomeria japonica TaxID=3369 RepID=UPI0027DA43AB|nr:lipase-like PAD4 [Cryptomeria japonica]
MDTIGETPRFDHGYYMGSFIAASNLPAQAWKACLATNLGDNPYLITEDEEEGILFIAFKGPLDGSAVFEVGGHFGEFEIKSENGGLFGLVEDGALVHEGLFNSFLHMWENSGVETQVLKAAEQKETIVFTGHSLAGAIASLATLSVLEKHGRKFSIFCVTFGSPLIGDNKFGQAIRKRGWDSKFCHVVLVHDIVPRLLLTPRELIHEPMEALLPYWSTTMKEGSNEENQSVMAGITLSNQQIENFYYVVLQHVSALVTYSNPAGSISSTNMTRRNIKSLFNLSPFRPFGYFLFCSRNGAVCIENHEVVLQLLHCVLENSDVSLDWACKNCISEHTEYGSCFSRIVNNRMRSGITDVRVHHELPAATSSSAICIALQLEALGLGVQNVRAQLALHEVGEDSMRLSINSNKQIVELSKAQKAMAELEWYKRRCTDDGIGYYDAFKQQKDRKDFRANINRGKLATFWDEFIQMVENNELPPDFQCRSKWIYSATAYRQLVEPLDIAYHYRHDRHEVSGHYLSAGRPRRYKILQKWFEDKMQSEKQEIKPRTRPASLTQDSCFWAYFEEVNHSLENYTTESMAKLKEFENRVNSMIDAQELSSEIFLENSSFMLWWKNKLPEEYKLTSPLFPLMEGGWIQYALQ